MPFVPGDEHAILVQCTAHPRELRVALDERAELFLVQQFVELRVDMQKFNRACPNTAVEQRQFSSQPHHWTASLPKARTGTGKGCATPPSADRL